LLLAVQRKILGDARAQSCVCIMSTSISIYDTPFVQLPVTRVLRAHLSEEEISCLAAIHPLVWKLLYAEKAPPERIHGGYLYDVNLRVHKIDVGRKWPGFCFKDLCAFGTAYSVIRVVQADAAGADTSKILERYDLMDAPLVNRTLSFGELAFFYCCRNGRLDCVKYCVGLLHVNPNCHFNYALSLAACAQENTLQYLLRCPGVDVDNNGGCALLKAAHWTHLPCVKLLLEAGADPTITCPTPVLRFLKDKEATYLAEAENGSGSGAYKRAQTRNVITFITQFQRTRTQKRNNNKRKRVSSSSS